MEICDVKYRSTAPKEGTYEDMSLQACCHIERQVNDSVLNFKILAVDDIRRMQHSGVFGEAFFDGTERIALPFMSTRIEIIRMRGILDCGFKRPFMPISVAQRSQLKDTLKKLEEEFSFTLL